MEIGANFYKEKCDFTVWAPYASKTYLKCIKDNEIHKMNKAKDGYWKLTLNSLGSTLEYVYKMDNGDYKPDPASQHQPLGVFGPSAVQNHRSFSWQDQDWLGLKLKEMIFYEIHVGTFTKEGTFIALQKKIKELSDLGINAIELMPIAQFSGERGWGYDTVFPFAVHNSYGSPDDLKRLVNECHLNRIAVFVDTIYNHLGPEGGFLNDYGPYFLKDRMTRWGPTINLDSELCEDVRNYFIENTLHWLRDYHIDGIRLDAVLSMPDTSKKHFLQQMTETIKNFALKMGRKMWIIAESGYNETVVLKPRSQGGFGFDGQWLDDFQHALHAIITGEKEGYYHNYGTMTDLMHVLKTGYAFLGGVNEPFRPTKPNELFHWIPSYRQIVFSQNHDQVGNRQKSERLNILAGIEAQKLAAGIVMLSPYTPLLFMGEEYCDKAPFNFFVDYSDKNLAKATREGRVKEFGEFHWKGEIPDPSDKRTFEKAKINWDLRNQGQGQKILSYYKELIQLRKNLKLSIFADRNRMKVLIDEKEKMLFINRFKNKVSIAIIANMKSKAGNYVFPFDGMNYIKMLDSSDKFWGGPGAIAPDKIKNKESLGICGFNILVWRRIQ